MYMYMYECAFIFNSMRYFDRAAVLVEACLEYGLISRNSQTCILECCM